MNFLPGIHISDFDYNLPPERIAQFPLDRRDESKLLIWKDNNVSEDIFKNIFHYLPESGIMIYNETRVIQARILFQKKTGAEIEIFCLEPVSPTQEIQTAFSQKSGVIWKCLIGNSKKWKDGKLIKRTESREGKMIVTAERVETHRDHSLIKFEWEPATKSFSEILVASGIIPLPPYVHRPAVDSDKKRYQTIYARSEGSVAAPTAGLHFTEQVLESLKKKNISFEEVTLHVGAGTFRPVSEAVISRHEMHTEKIFISKDTVLNLLQNLDKKIIVVGTTTTRTIESLYWFGVKLLTEKRISQHIDIKQWDPYQPSYNQGIPVNESLRKVLEFMDENRVENISGQTQLMIVPGYKFKIADILITNFHMPRSTLLLLVSAFIGDGWKAAYRYALNHDFRFLSYGDACLFFRQDSIQ
ncbi:MAG: S-adenosylmethionine:tRNA ribosyltransferase-isomerase [Bacteroidales bacterium]|nr:S-adenosylmethionine:tRNA ribosyltransferase-isomerase [Bacteroidales bacterium]